jgi:hypothetical protein
MRKFLNRLLVSSFALWLHAAISPSNAGAIRIYMEPRGVNCYIRNGWHYDRLGHHFFGSYQQCFRIKPQVALGPARSQQPNVKK